MIAADVDRVVSRHVFGAEHDDVPHNSHRRSDWENPFFLRDKFFQDIRLRRPRYFLQVIAAGLRQCRIHGDQNPRCRIDRHGDRDTLQVDAFEECFQVIQRIDGYPLTSNLAFRERIIGVVSHKGRHVEVHRESGLSLRQQIAESLPSIPATKTSRATPRSSSPTISRATRRPANS